jgi:four helix bundle protein
MSAPYEELIVWQKAIDLSVLIYLLTKEYPDTERFGLTNQLRRVSVSIPSNIAEGFGRSTSAEYKSFLGHARGSLYELQTQLVIAGKLEFGSAESREKAYEISTEVGKMLVAMMKKLSQEKTLQGSPNIPTG